MAVVRLRAPLSELAGGNREVRLDGATVRDVLSALEQEHPSIAGWILDEQKSIREHVNVFVNGESIRYLDGLATPVGERDEVEILPAVSGGSRPPARP